MLPNWLHIGAAKCASTWLWRVCIEHPEIYVPTLHRPDQPDNVNFFTVHYHRGLDWYQQTYFDTYREEFVVGEFSNSYYQYPKALERIKQHLPDIKLTLTIRHPVERAYLSWAHLHLKKKPTGLDIRKGIGIPFEKVLSVHGHAWFLQWIDPSFYARHIKQIWKLFPKEQVKVMVQDDLCKNQEEFLRNFLEFLGVKADFPSSLFDVDINPDPDDVWDYLNLEVREELIEVYRSDILQLSEILERDLSYWLT